MTQGANAADTVSVRLSFTPFAAHIPIYVAKEKGYYSQAGLDVQILAGRGSSFAAMTVGSGKEEFGIADAAAVVTTRAQGVPIVALANLQQDNGVALFATESSRITAPAQLKDRNVGVFTGSTTTIFLQALLKKNGLTMDDIKPVTVRSSSLSWARSLPASLWSPSWRRRDASGHGRSSLSRCAANPCSDAIAAFVRGTPDRRRRRECHEVIPFAGLA
jgi:ABC-type nitrate/sulfonate/bicarbonate transport system substrate-binding protein